MQEGDYTREASDHEGAEAEAEEARYGARTKDAISYSAEVQQGNHGTEEQAVAASSGSGSGVRRADQC